jgi:hypothetical protein
MVKLADTLQRWRDRAKGMRAAAARMRDPTAKRMAFGIAEGYELLAKHIEERAAAPRKRRPGTAFTVRVGGAVHRGTFEVSGGLIFVSRGIWSHSQPLGDYARPQVLAKRISAQAVRSKVKRGNPRRGNPRRHVTAR